MNVVDYLNNKNFVVEEKVKSLLLDSDNGCACIILTLFFAFVEQLSDISSISQSFFKAIQIQLNFVMENVIFTYVIHLGNNLNTW